MSDPKKSARPSPQVYALYASLLWLYPVRYRQRFGQAMLFVFEEMLQDEVAEQGEVGVKFWWAVLVDLIGSATVQHWESLRRYGMKTYLRETLHLQTIHVIGAILLLPFCLLLFTDFVGRVIQGDLTHPNLAVYNVLSHTVLYSGKAPLLWAIIVYGPLLAVAINLVPFLISLRRQHQQLTLTRLLLVNPLALVIMGMGLAFVVIAFGHDVIPCFAHQLWIKGLHDFGQTVSLCRQA